MPAQNDKEMIKAVLFDMGGVLFRLNVPRCVNNFKTKAGFMDIEDFINIYQQQGFIGDFEAGKIDEEGFYANCMAHSRPGTTRQTLADCFCSLLDGTNEDAVELLRSLRGKYRLFLLSNNNPISLKLLGEELAKKGLPIDETFEKKFCSFQLKTQKPGKEFFLKAIEGIGLDPSEMLLIDDSTANLQTARELGIKTLQYFQDQDIRSTFSPDGTAPQK